MNAYYSSSSTAESPDDVDKTREHTWSLVPLPV